MRTLRICILVALASALVLGRAVCADKPTQDYWMGIYCNGSKIGSCHVTVTNDRGTWAWQKSIKIRFRNGAQAYRWDVEQSKRADGDFVPVWDEAKIAYRDSSMATDQSATTITTYTGNKGSVITVSGGAVDRQEHNLTEPEQASVTAGSALDLGNKKLSVGDKFEARRKRPNVTVLPEPYVGVNSGPATVSVLRREKVEVSGSTYDALVLSEKDEQATTNTWRLDNGEVVKQESPEAHVVWLREDQKLATEADDGQGPLINSFGPPKSPKIELTGHSPAPLDYWLGIYCKSDKVGNLHITRNATKVDGKDAFCQTQTLHMQMKVKGKLSDIELTHSLYAGSDLLPIKELMQGKGPNPETLKQQTCVMDFRYGADSVIVKIALDGEEKSQTIPLSEDDRRLVAAGCAFDLGLQRLSVGAKLDIHHTSLEVHSGTEVNWLGDDVALAVTRDDTVAVNGVSQKVLVLSTKSDHGYETTLWQKEDGEILKAEIPKESVTLLQETKEQANDPLAGSKGK